MILVAMYGLLTVFCVIYALKKRKTLFLLVPFAALFGYVLFKIMMVPLPFWETVQFIIGLK